MKPKLKILLTSISKIIFKIILKSELGENLECGRGFAGGRHLDQWNETLEYGRDLASGRHLAGVGYLGAGKSGTFENFGCTEECRENMIFTRKQVI